MSFDPKVARGLTCTALACTVAATLFAAAPEPEPKILELDEVVVASKVLIRLQDFTEFPKYDAVVVSPDGTRVAMAWIDENANYQRSMAILEYPSMKPLRTFALEATYSQAQLDWANNSQLVLQPKWPLRTFLRILVPVGVLVTVDDKGGNFRFINQETLRMGDPVEMPRRDEEALADVPLKGSPDGGKWPGRNSSGPVRLLETRIGGQPDVLSFQTTRNRDRRGNGEGFGAFQLGIRDMKQTRVATLPVHGGRFVSGPEQRIALAYGVDAENREVVYYLPPEARDAGKDWKLMASSDSGQRGLRPIAWTGTGEEYYALDGRDAPTRGVVVWNAADNTQKLLYRHASVDIDSAELDPAGRAFVFHGNDHFPVYWYPDPNHGLARLHRIVAQKVPREMVEIVSASDNLAVAAVRVSSVRRPPVYLVVDTKTANSSAGFFEFPTLRGTRLTKVDPVVFQARDGLLIRGYITIPEDASGRARRNLPLVVIAHDGPVSMPGSAAYEQASAAYEYERQLFASRGYAVLQVNRRGSPGRGVAYERAGDGKWGQETQNDFIDGVRWAIKEGVADGSRVCFYGTGYGAYSAMVAAAHEPDLFKCVIGVQGAYDLPAMLGDGKKEIPPAMAQVLGTDMAELKARSPISLAKSIKAKVLLMPQEKGQNFPVEQSNRMRAALRSAGNTPQVTLLGQEYGGQHSTDTRSNGYAAILKFVEQNIGR